MPFPLRKKTDEKNVSPLVLGLFVISVVESFLDI